MFLLLTIFIKQYVLEKEDLLNLKYNHEDVSNIDGIIIVVNELVNGINNGKYRFDKKTSNDFLEMYNKKGIKEIIKSDKVLKVCGWELGIIIIMLKK